MKLLFLLLLCVLILARSVQSPSFDVKLHGSLSIPIASFVERSLFIKTFCHQKYLNRRIVYTSGHQGTFNPAVITNKVHMVHGNIRYTWKDHWMPSANEHFLLLFRVEFRTEAVFSHR